MRASRVVLRLSGSLLGAGVLGVLLAPCPCPLRGSSVPRRAERAIAPLTARPVVAPDALGRSVRDIPRPTVPAPELAADLVSTDDLAAIEGRALGTSDPQVRAAAIAALGTWGEADSRRLELFARIARTDPSLEARLAALDALVAAARLEPGLVHAANDRLIEIAALDLDPAVRCSAASSIAGPPADEDQVARLLAIGRADADPAVRQAAVQALGESAPALRARVVAALERELARETDPVLRRTFVVTLVRAGGAAARSSLFRIAEAQPDLAPEANDWLAALDGGATDIDTLWEKKRSIEAARTHGPVMDE